MYSHTLFVSSILFATPYKFILVMTEVRLARTCPWYLQTISVVSRQGWNTEHGSDRDQYQESQVYS